MSSPFPGMDPYLEGELWQEFHQRLANAISAQLMPRLRPKYVALLEKYYVMDYSGVELFDVPTSPRLIYPDVGVTRTGAAAAAIHGASDLVLTPPTAEVRSALLAPRTRVEIRDVAQRRLVTVIELLSRANKVGEGAREYYEKRTDIYRSTAHLLEIDLLRAGTRIALAEPVPPADYYIYLNRAERRLSTTVWAIALQQKLPTVAVPLLEPDADVLLDVQAAFTASFDLVGYDLLIDYAVLPPPPELSPEATTWLEALLCEKRRYGESI